jgi:hypothetical protein
MSQIQRYTARGYEVGVDDPEPYPDDLVRYSDYAALEAQVEALQRENAVFKTALVKLRDCDWVITPRDRMDAVRTIAREALSRATQPAPQEGK